MLRLVPDTRQVVVGPRSALLRDRLSVRDLNWLGDRPLGRKGARVSVRLRSAMPPVPATAFALDDGRAAVALNDPQAGVAPGQACVFYDGERVLGGGWIERTSGPRNVRAAA